MHAGRRRMLLAVCLALAGAALPCRLASAAGVSPLEATPDQKKNATDHFKAGKDAIAVKDWDKAVAELRASLDVVDSPNARLELARALRDSGQPDQAWTEYGRVIDDATKLCATEERYAKTADAATNERLELLPKLAFVTVTVAHAPADATLKVAGRPVPADQWAAPIVAPPGAVDVVLTGGDGKELARKTVNVAVGEKAPVALDAQPPPAAPSRPPTT